MPKLIEIEFESEQERYDSIVGMLFGMIVFILVAIHWAGMSAELAVMLSNTYFVTPIAYLFSNEPRLGYFRTGFFGPFYTITYLWKKYISLTWE